MDKGSREPEGALGESNQSKEDEEKQSTSVPQNYQFS
jgi:hypothetical protein